MKRSQAAARHSRRHTGTFPAARGRNQSAAPLPRVHWIPEDLESLEESWSQVVDRIVRGERIRGRAL